MYRGISIRDIPIRGIEWTVEQAKHVRTRSERQPGDSNIEPEWATEAATDPEAIARANNSGTSLEVIGMSRSAGMVLKVWLYPKDVSNVTSGEWWGSSACVADKRDAREYGSREE